MTVAEDKARSRVLFWVAVAGLLMQGAVAVFYAGQLSGRVDQNSMRIEKLEDGGHESRISVLEARWADILAELREIKQVLRK